MIEDFNSIYPEKKESLYENFPVYKEKILQIGRNTSNTLKDSSLKCIVNEYLDLSLGIV